DEVLAVGDAEFQKKCLGKMREVTEGGRTVLFVSHNLPAVAALCTQGIYLKNGRLVMTGETDTILQLYKDDAARAAVAEPEGEAVHRRGSGTHRIVSITPSAPEQPAREPLVFTARIRRHEEDGPFHFSLHLKDEWDTDIAAVNTAYLEGGMLEP